MIWAIWYYRISIIVKNVILTQPTIFSLSFKFLLLPRTNSATCFLWIKQERGCIEFDFCIDLLFLFKVFKITHSNYQQSCSSAKIKVFKISFFLLKKPWMKLVSIQCNFESRFVGMEQSNWEIRAAWQMAKKGLSLFINYDL